MKVSELQAKQGKIDIVLEIIEKGDSREFSKFGTTGKVCNAKGKDDSGEITLTLWNEQVEQVKLGDKVHITNGYVSEWQGDKQLGTGKFGQLEVVSDSDAASAEAPAEESTEAPAEDAPAKEAPTEDAPAEPEDSSSEEKIE